MIDVTSIKDDLYNLIDEIKKSNEYVNLLKSYEHLMNDKESLELINDFNKKRDEYNLYKTNNNAKALSVSKAKLYKSKLYLEYIDKLKIYNDMMSLIEKEINDAIYKDELKKVLKMGE